MLLGNPAQLMKILANKAIDMVLNFIITNPPSALLKAVFKGIEAIAGKSLVELIRLYIPFADKLFDKIAASGPVQSIMKPLEGPVNSVGGMIEQVTDQAAGVVDNAEQSAMSSMGNGSKLLSGFAGSSGSQSGQAGTAGESKGQEKKGGQEGGKSQGGGDFLSLLKSGVHTRLMTFGLMNIRKLGAKVIAAGAAKVTGVIKKMLTPKVKFKLGAEEHELWVEKGKNRNVVMMASKNPAPIKVKIQEGEMTNNGEVNNKCERIESEKDDQKVVQQNEVLADTIQAVTAGVGGATYKKWKVEVVNGRKVYKYADMTAFHLDKPQKVDPKYVHPVVQAKINSGATNLELMKQGYAPIGLDGRPINLHHVIGQEPGPMVELSGSIHSKYHKPLHGLIEDGNSFRNDPKKEAQYERFRKKYWKERAKDFE